MTLEEAITLIRPDKPFTETLWADLGCGSGLFTYALASLLPQGSTIYSIDKNIHSFVERPGFDDITINQIELNFERDSLPLNNPDGIVMANSLHFVRDKKTFIARLITFKSLSTLLLVEYDTNVPNPWVPYPVSFLSAQNIFLQGGYSSVIKINERRSAFNKANLYSAIIRK